MDPLTAALTLANTIAEIVKLSIEAMPADTRAEYARMQVEDLKAWRAFLERFTQQPTISPALLEHAQAQVDALQAIRESVKKIG
jgi:hypothetical protein